MIRSLISRPAHTSDAADSKRYRLLLTRPWLAGLRAAAIVMAIMLAIIMVFHVRNSALLETDMDKTLRRAAIAAAQTVDPVVHQTLVSASQQGSPDYERECARLDRTRLSYEGPETFRFIYTCILRDGQVLFVLDPTPAGDADGDQVEDKAFLLDVYEDPPDGLIATLSGAGVQVMSQPYRDKWGTFMSAFAPIYDDQGTLIAAAGVDMDLSSYRQSIRRVWRDTVIAGTIGLILSLCVGAAAALHGKYLIDSIEKLNDAMERAMAGEHAKDRFLAIMSHEFRTPMNAIVGSTELLRGTRLNQFQAEQTQTILDSSGKLLAMLDDVLDYSRDETSELIPEPVEVRKLCSEMVASLSHEAERKELLLRWDVDDAVPPLWLTHPRHLQRILHHLLTNAVKFTRHGEVKLIVRPAVDGEGKMALRFSVSDTGIGIERADHQEILRPFVQLDSSASRSHEGAGLGLAICERLCGEIQTALQVESESGKGSTFSLVLPGEEVVVKLKMATLITSDRLQRGIHSRMLEKRGWQVQRADELGTAATLPPAELVMFDLAAVSPEAAADYAQRVVNTLSAREYVAIDSILDQAGKDAVLKAGVARIVSRNPVSSAAETAYFSI